MGLFDKISRDNENTMPRPDMARCSECGWEGNSNDCKKGIDGDWEGGYYEIDLCPKCPDGGCVDDYFWSEEEVSDG